MAVTVADVRLIVDTGYEDSDITSFIAIATTLVSETITGTDLSAGRLDLITRYLTAHLIAISDDDVRASMKKAGNTQFSFSELSGLGFKSTRFGQIAVALDISGTLSSLTSYKAKLTALPVVTE